MRNPELWQRLRAYRFDGPGSAPFSVKLAAAEGWSPAYTARVIEEYRRFLYLTQISARQVTPSQTVDAAWHLHLTYTRAYWEDLCAQVIGRPVHHEPGAGAEEMPRYRDQFAATKALYEAEFGIEPPADIWGRAERRGRKPLGQLLRDETGASQNAGLALGIGGAFILLAVLPQMPWWVYIGVFGGVFWLIARASSQSTHRGPHGEDGDSGDDDWRSGDGRENSGGDRKGSERGGFWGGGDGDGGGCGGD